MMKDSQIDDGDDDNEDLDKDGDKSNFMDDYDDDTFHLQQSCMASRSEIFLMSI